MEAEFWHGKWEREEIAFHLAQANPLLTQHFASLQLAPGARVFLPLCGKTLDIHWLRQGGYRLAGIDLSEIAIRALFEELQLQPVVTQHADLLRFSADGIDMFVGDFFSLDAALLETVDAVYDRAALVALPPAMRAAYSQHLQVLSQYAAQLLITYEYEQALADGPPFAVLTSEVQQHYAQRYQLSHLTRVAVAGGIKGKAPATESVWLLQTRTDV